MRRISTPSDAWRATNQLYRTLRPWPMWKYPVGDGEKRARTGVGILLTEEPLGHHDALDLIRALVDLRDLGVAHESLHRKVLREARSAEQLDAVGRHLHRDIGRAAL